jgi:hypothetical protein
VNWKPRVLLIDAYVEGRGGKGKQKAAKNKLKPVFHNTKKRHNDHRL